MRDHGAHQTYSSCDEDSHQFGKFSEVAFGNDPRFCFRATENPEKSPTNGANPEYANIPLPKTMSNCPQDIQPVKKSALQSAGRIHNRTNNPDANSERSECVWEPLVHTKPNGNENNIVAQNNFLALGNSFDYGAESTLVDRSIFDNLRRISGSSAHKNIPRFVDGTRVSTTEYSRTSTDMRKNKNQHHKPPDMDIEQITEKFSKVWIRLLNMGRIHEYKNDNMVKTPALLKPSTVQVQAETIEAEKVQAKEKFEMSADEREAIANEIHGVDNCAVAENPSMIAASLLALREEIDHHLHEDLLDNPRSNQNRKGMPSAIFSKKAYQLGLHLNSEYIQSDSFRLCFLRKALFHIEDAAIQFFRYLDVIYDMFGQVALMRPLYLTDLTERELRYLNRGQQQLFPSRDRAGRRIIAFLGCNNTEYTLREKYRVRTYLESVMAQDETTQKLGYVSIGVIQRSGKVDLGGERNPKFFQRCNKACPVRCSALHICFPNGHFAYYFIQIAVILFCDRKMRSLLRCHRGSTLETTCSLSGYGIPSGDIPITSGGKVKTKNVTSFVKARTAIEAVQKHQIETHCRHRQHQQLLRLDQRSAQHLQNAAVVGASPKTAGGGGYPILVRSLIDCPDSRCVVFGNKGMYEHNGNLRFRHFLIDTEMRRTTRIKNFDESVTSMVQFVRDIIDEAKSGESTGGVWSKGETFRFYSYKRDLFLYAEITDPLELQRRVHQMLRDSRKRSKGDEDLGNSAEGCPAHTIIYSNDNVASIRDSSSGDTTPTPTGLQPTPGAMGVTSLDDSWPTEPNQNSGKRIKTSNA
ncbi:unnamed protein product [Pseudo-nitzschia multistriata]|uniref:Uncharacterized protein n=1 Tax=Pseudo-nitzschia multistriata TaxID=183589 RepID=A0A448Z1N0_9STRA|nr:unnamed protein product [Pseudo-nitzschia multistriata]